MTRVCLISHRLPPEYGGAEIASYRYGERMAAAGRKPVVIGPPGQADYPDYVRLTSALPDLTGMAVRSRLSLIAKRLWPVLYSTRREYDVIHVFNSAPLFNLLSVPMARVLNKPVVFESSLVGSDDPLALMRRRKGPRKRRLLKYPLRFELYRRGSAFVSKSPALVRAYEESPLPGWKHVLVPYAVDCEKFRPSEPASKVALRKTLGLPEGPTVLFVGGVTKRKGVHHLLEAFKGVVDSVPNARLVLVGPAYKYDAEFVQGLHDRTEAWGLSGHVTFVDKVAGNVDEYMRAADVFTLPSSREGLPISVLEAMATGLAIVGSDIPEIADSQITHGENGLLVSFGDILGLTQALTSAAAEADLRSRLGEAARSRALEIFSVPAVDRDYQLLYEALLGGRAPAEVLGSIPRQAKIPFQSLEGSGEVSRDRTSLNRSALLTHSPGVIAGQEETC